jgi:hypothetical protein
MKGSNLPYVEQYDERYRALYMVKDGRSHNNSAIVIIVRRVPFFYKKDPVNPGSFEISRLFESFLSFFPTHLFDFGSIVDKNTIRG